MLNSWGMVYSLMERVYPVDKRSQNNWGHLEDNMYYKVQHKYHANVEFICTGKLIKYPHIRQNFQQVQLIQGMHWFWHDYLVYELTPEERDRYLVIKELVG